NLSGETSGDSLRGTNVKRKLAPLHRWRALWTSTVDVIQNYGDVRDSPTDWADGRATRYLVRRQRPSGTRRARKGRSRHQSRPGIGYSARKAPATGTCRASRIGTARRGFTFPLLTGRYGGAGRPPTRG